MKIRKKEKYGKEEKKKKYRTGEESSEKEYLLLQRKNKTMAK